MVGALPVPSSVPSPTCRRATFLDVQRANKTSRLISFGSRSTFRDKLVDSVVPDLPHSNLGRLFSVLSANTKTSSHPQISVHLTQSSHNSFRNPFRKLVLFFFLLKLVSKNMFLAVVGAVQCLSAGTRYNLKGD